MRAGRARKTTIFCSLTYCTVSPKKSVAECRGVVRVRGCGEREEWGRGVAKVPCLIAKRQNLEPLTPHQHSAISAPHRDHLAVIRRPRKG